MHIVALLNRRTDSCFHLFFRFPFHLDPLSILTHYPKFGMVQFDSFLAGIHTQKTRSLVSNHKKSITIWVTGTEEHHYPILYLFSTLFFFFFFCFKKAKNQKRYKKKIGEKKKPISGTTFVPPPCPLYLRKKSIKLINLHKFSFAWFGLLLVQDVLGWFGEIGLDVSKLGTQPIKLDGFDLDSKP